MSDKTTIETLQDKKADLEKQRDDFVRQAQAQIERFIGAIAVLQEMIDRIEKEE